MSITRVSVQKRDCCSRLHGYSPGLGQVGVSGRDSIQGDAKEKGPRAYKPSLVLLQCLLLELYLILLPVFILIHCGIGLFCFCFLAKKRLILKVLWDDILSTILSPLWRWSKRKK